LMPPVPPRSIDKMPAPSQSSGVPETSRRRSQRVILTMPIIVRTEDVPRESSFEEHTNTLIVNLHGALILLAGKVIKGQKLRMKNRVTQVEQLCQVASIGMKSEGKTQVGVEFLKPSPDFWQISFPPEDWAVPDAAPVKSGKTK
jgi:hypothetical protein